MKTFIDCVYTNEAREGLKWVFEQMNLPIPQEGEFYTGGLTNGTPGVFLDYYGVTLRLEENEKVNLLHHPGYSLPIVSFYLDKRYRLDLQPGAPLIENRKKLQLLRFQFANDEVRCDDVVRGNCFYLPLKTAEFPSGYPVVFDPRVLRPLSDSTRLVKQKIHERVFDLSCDVPKDNQGQCGIFSDLRNDFSQTIQSFDGNFDRKHVAEFWGALRRAKNDNRLVDSWNKQRRRKYHPVQLQRAKQASHAYGNTLRDHHGVVKPSWSFKKYFSFPKIF